MNRRGRQADYGLSNDTMRWSERTQVLHTRDLRGYPDWLALSLCGYLCIISQFLSLAGMAREGLWIPA